MDIQGKRIFITGAARGIGAQIASALASGGAELVLSDVNLESLDTTTASLRARGATVESLLLDVTDPSQTEALRDRFSNIDVLINNAGVVHGGEFLSASLAEHRVTTAVNLDGVMAVTHALLPGMLERPEAMVVNIASAAGFIGLPFGTSYAASKWGVVGFGESLRLELAELGQSHVRVMHVCPGYVRGELFDGADPIATTGLLSPEGVARCIVRGIERNRLWVRMPWVVRWTRVLMAVLPRPIADWVLRATGTARSMRGWRGRS
jgi:all-trans-retinol dehydrogenase (NAD+)